MSQFTISRRRICFSYSQNVKTIFKLLMSVVIDHLMEICKNSQAEIEQLW